ncbi:uncharacterized protein LOC142335358 [Convolutriloba macropyga]|uniref:uncharacterized protein LOC142335358 n=1 Tax=Convolutriloba macropyga TaxID=536237 RepID=UPI003F525CB1
MKRFATDDSRGPASATNGKQTSHPRDENNSNSATESPMAELNECIDLLWIYATGFDHKEVSDEQLRLHFVQFGSPQEINVIEEYANIDDADNQKNAFVYCQVKMSKYEETVEAVSKFNQVYHQKGLENLVVMRYKPKDLRDFDDRFVPNGVELEDIPDTDEAKKGLQPFLESIPGIRCVSILLLTPERNDDPPRFNVYFETVDMADTLIMLRQARYPAANNQTIRFLQVPRNSETMSHAKAMKTPYVPPKCIDPEKNKKLRCNFDVRRGYQDGYRKTMSNIQDVIQQYLAGAPPAVADGKKMATAINKMIAKPVPTNPPASVTCNVCPPTAAAH